MFSTPFPPDSISLPGCPDFFSFSPTLRFFYSSLFPVSSFSPFCLFPSPTSAFSASLILISEFGVGESFRTCCVCMRALNLQCRRVSNPKKRKEYIHCRLNTYLLGIHSLNSPAYPHAHAQLFSFHHVSSHSLYLSTHYDFH